MISVLIPIYNYNIVPLVNELHKQLTSASIAFEIICLDDGSEQRFIDQNLAINTLGHTHLIISETNKGRIKSRHQLSENATYDWLLFLDADIMPQGNFIDLYLTAITEQVKAYFGGVCYKREVPDREHMLRWKYGIKHEEVTAAHRNKNPYKHIVSANMLINRNVFRTINSEIKQNSYGLDNLFGLKLKEHSISIEHINNDVFHLGIEKSDVYLKKKEEAAETLLHLIDEGEITKHDNALISLFLFLKRFKLNYLFSSFYKHFKSKMRPNLLSENPSIKLLQLYRISYLCYKDLNPN